MKEASEEYRQSQDIIGEFIDDQIEAYEGERLSRAVIFKAYRQWCEDNGERSIAQPVLTQKLKERGWKDAPRGSERCFAGYKLKNPLKQIGQQGETNKDELLPAKHGKPEPVAREVRAT